MVTVVASVTLQDKVADSPELILVGLSAKLSYNWWYGNRWLMATNN
jgi:hypothetical protein